MSSSNLLEEQLDLEDENLMSDDESLHHDTLRDTKESNLVNH